MHEVLAHDLIMLSSVLLDIFSSVFGHTASFRARNVRMRKTVKYFEVSNFFRIECRHFTIKIFKAVRRPKMKKKLYT